MTVHARLPARLPPDAGARHRVRARVVVRYRACGPGSLSASLRRRGARAARTIVVGAAGRGHLTLPRVRPGRYLLRARLGAATLTRRVVVAGASRTSGGRTARR